NDVPHIGHAYCTIAADVLARYHRALGDDVRLLTGTDEHGQKMVESAAAKGLTPGQLSDQNVVQFKNLWQLLNIQYDDFIRTSETRHETRVQTLVQRLIDAGEIYLGHYEGWYDVGQEEFVTETEAAANDYKSAVNKKPLVRYKEPSYFFRMSKYQQRLLDHIAAHPDFVAPETRRNEVVSKVAMGLRDLSVSRATLAWGVRMPNDPAHTIYVWIDALSNYYTAVGAGEPGDLAKYWPAELHLVGKDILWFHAVIWPCLLMALGIELPRTVFAHGWWTCEGEKMSKTLNNFVSPAEVIARTDANGVKIGVDRFRYFVLREVPFGQDSDFAFAQVVSKCNGDLANNVGNLLNRTTNMISRYFEGKVPAEGAPGEAERPVRDLADALAGRLAEAMDSCAFQRAIQLALDLATSANKYIDDTAPFKLAKDPSQRDRLGTILYTCAEATRLVALVLAPFIPETIERVWRQLPYRPADDGFLPSQLTWGKLKPGSAVTKGEPLFPRLEFGPEGKS
ncbi:MAG: methionine--tRNA ligase, partial [Phycisphaerae bacterium]|nr:methionine--tRNA ligase [Phycisphaerae bacterium]